MDYKIIWMDEAIADLKSIVLGLEHERFLAELFTPAQSGVWIVVRKS